MQYTNWEQMLALVIENALFHNIMSHIRYDKESALL